MKPVTPEMLVVLLSRARASARATHLLTEGGEGVPHPAPRRRERQVLAGRSRSLGMLCP
jgi:hypothetical protein